MESVQERSVINSFVKQIYVVSVFVAYLLATEKTDQHSKAKYVLIGPNDVIEEEIVNLVERHIGDAVIDIKYKDFAIVDT